MDELFDTDDHSSLGEQDSELALLSGFSYPDEEGNLVELTETEQDEVVQKISKHFERLDNEKSSIKERWRITEKAIRGVVSEVKKDRFYGLVPFGKQTVQTLISHFWGRSLQTPKLFFSVEGTDQESKEMAPLHKENLLRHCEKDRVRQKLDRSLHLHGLPKGVCIFHVGYENCSQELRGPAGLVDKWQTGQFGEAEGEYKNIDKKVYEGATVQIVDPYDFVFDTENHCNWDACVKYHRSYMVYEDIASDDNFNNYEDLKELVKERLDVGRKKQRNKKTDLKGIDENGRIELIEFHGDFRLPGGAYLRNWTIVIAGRKKVIRFEKNPYFINPFVKWCYEDTEDGWGISPVDYILPHIDAASILLSMGVEGAKLSINPPWLAAEKNFQQKKHFITEGKVISYTPNTLAPNTPPTPIQFKYDAPFPYMQLFESQSEATTGATRQLSGNVTTNDKVQTATEFQGLQVVGNQILDRLVDLFNLDCKIPLVQKIALINAMFNPEERVLSVEKPNGLKDFQQVTKQTYFGNYDYLIEDNKAEIERKQNLNEKLALFKEGMQHPLIYQQTNALELFMELWRDFGYGTPGKFIMDDNEYVDFAAKQAAMQDLIAIKKQQALQRLMQEEGMIPNVLPIQAGLPSPEAGASPVGAIPIQPPENIRQNSSANVA